MADDFLSTYAPLANDIATRTNIDPSVVLGIIDTETGRGQHVSGNNIFGISPSGPQGQYVAGYPDVQTASNAFINLMQTPRYASVAAAPDPVSQSAALVKSGYNTANPNYASIVANKALQFGKQLGYQDSGGNGSGAQQSGASINVTSSQPAPDYSGQPTATAPAAIPATPAPAAPDYNTPAPAAVPPPTQPPTQDPTAKDRVLADPALNPDGGTPTTAQPPAQGQSAQPQTAKDRVLADPALQTTTTPAEKPPQGQLPTVSEYGDLGNAWWNTQANPPAGAPPGITVPSGEDIANALQPTVNALQPAPNTTYASILPLARDDKTGALRLAMPSLPRDLMLGTVQGVQGVLTGDVGAETTVDTTGQFHYGMTPGANLLLGAGARPLAFSGANPLLRPPEPTFGGPLPPTADELTAAVRRADQMPPRATADTAAPQTAAASAAPDLPPVPDGYVRLYHGGADPASGGARWVTPDYAYARDYRPGQPVSYVDVPKDNPAVQAAVASHPDEPMRVASFNAPEDIAAQLRPVGQPSAGTTAAATPAEAAANTAWVGKTIDQVGNIVQENAANGGPASLGATATPEQLAAMSPEMAKAYRRMAEVNRVVSPIEGEDTSIKVPGSVPTEAEAKGDPVTSTREVMTRQYRPEAFEGPQGVLTKNNAARLQTFDEQTLSDPQIASLSEDQARQARADEATVYKNAGPVDGAPVAAQLKQLLANPRIAEQPDVMKVLQPIHDALYGADGNLKTDIASYWGMHDNLMNRLAKAKDPLQASSSEKFAFNQLLDAKNAVDGAMNQASGGAFQTFLDNQSKFFQQKNAATILRDFRSKMTNPNTGMIQPNAFHRFVTDLAVRRGKPGIDPAMDIPDEVMGKLMDIDDDLKRAGRIDLGKPRGSPTNLYFELANGLGIVGAHSAVHLMGGGPIANLALQSGINAAKQRVARMRTNALVDRALNYPPAAPPPNPNPPGAFVPPNQLQFPPPP